MVEELKGMQMKRIVGAASTLAAAVAAAASANAADIAAPAAYDWSGFYAGVNAGAAMDSSSLSYWYDREDFVTDETTKLPGLSGEMDSDQTAFTGGGILGYNHQIDRIVLGVEADFNYLGLTYDASSPKSFDIVTPGQAPDINAINTDDLSYEMNWFGTLRGRLGYAFDNMMIYGTGGLAYGNVSVDHSVEGCFQIDVPSPPPPECATLDGNESEMQWGWTLGGGLEYGLDRWSLGLEYLYVDLGSGDWETERRHYDGYDVSPKGEAQLSFSVIRATAKIRF